MGEIEHDALQDLPGQGGDASQAGAPDGATGQYLTLAQAEALVNERVDRALRQSQSMVDKAEARTRSTLSQQITQLENVVKDLTALGHQVPPEVIEKMQQKLVMRSLTEADAPPVKPGENGGPAQAGPSLDPNDPSQVLAAAVMGEMQKYGILLHETDPEFALVKIDSDDPAVVIPSVRSALKAKIKRLADASDGEAEGAEPEAGQSAKRRARVPSGKGGGSGAPLPDLPAMDLFRMGYSGRR